MPGHGPLIFIDTNIFLDFYRATGAADFKLLDRLKKVHNRIITSGQVEMEFQKIRQKLILASLEKFEIIGTPRDSRALREYSRRSQVEYCTQAGRAQSEGAQE
jgi:hypothetical protein